MSQVQTLATFVSQDANNVTIKQGEEAEVTVPKASVNAADVLNIAAASDGQQVNIRIDEAFCNEAKLS